MPLVRQRYGKANVRVLRVQRDGDRHQARESRVNVILDGEFSRAYTDAANESFALTIGPCFLGRDRQVSEACVRVEETDDSRRRVTSGERMHVWSTRMLLRHYLDQGLTRRSCRDASG